MNVRERVEQGQSVRVRPLAKEAGIAASSIYAWVTAGKIGCIRVQGVVLIPAAAARPLLGMAEPAEPVAA